MRATRVSPTASITRCRPSLLADFRFGWFRYRVNVLPSDFGTTPATDAGIPGLNLDDTFASGLPAFFIGGDNDSRRMAFGSGLGDRVGRCNCPLDEDEQQFQVVGNITKLMGNHAIKFGIDVRRAYNLRVPSDRHRSGELNFENDRTRGPAGGGLALASFMLGDVTRFTRYVSPTTDARERQWRHFYYAQDVWRPTPKLTLNYGLRLDIINPQTVNEPGNGGFLDLATGLINVAGVGDIGLNGNVENSLNWAPRLGATYQLTEKTVLRAGYGRSYDIGVFGSLFGHSVTQNLPVLSVQELTAPNNFDSVFNLAQPAPAPVFPPVPPSGQFALPTGVFARALPRKQRPPHVDAFNVMVQHQLTETISVEAGYVGNRGGNVFAGDGPATNVNQAILTGFPTLPTDQRRPFFAGNVPNSSGFGGAFGWTQGIDYFCNCATNAYDSLQTRFTKRFSGGYSALASYTLQRAIQDNPDYFFFDSEMNRGPADWDRTHNFTLSLVAELPFGRERRYGTNVSPVVDAIIGGWQANTNTFIYSGLPFQVTYRDAGADRDTGGNEPARISSAIRMGRRPKSSGSTRRRSDRPEAPSSVRPAAPSGRWSATRCAGRATGASTRRCSSTSASAARGGSRCASRRSTCSTTSTSRIPIQRSACRGTRTPMPAGSTAPPSAASDPMRNFQFAREDSVLRMAARSAAL